MKHEPAVKRVHTAEVTCARTGPVTDDGVGEVSGKAQRIPVLADVEAWTAKLRSLGAPGDLPIRALLVSGLTVVVDLDALAAGHGLIPGAASTASGNFPAVQGR